MSSSQVSGGTRRPLEADFYQNPTDLFRWINYRRWDGALERAQTHPEDVRTWIVHNDRATNQLLWRHLPIHLCCMQSNVPLELIDVLLKVYPEGAECQDHEGMTPLHLCCLKGGVTEQLASLLLIHNPSAVCTADRYNRTPLDILKDSAGNGTNNSKNNVMRMLSGLENHLNRLKQSVQGKESVHLDAMQKSTASERIASQRVIMRLEKELETTKSVVSKYQAEIDSKNELEHDFEVKIQSLQRKTNEVQTEKESLQETIKKLHERIVSHQEQQSVHDGAVSEAQSRLQVENRHLHDKVRSIKLDASTARAMSGALEDKLKSHVEMDQEANAKILVLESSLQKAAAVRKTMEEKFRDKMVSVLKENTVAKETVEDLTKRNTSLESQVKELSDTVSSLISSQNILSAEQDRVAKAHEKYEQDMLESMENERNKLMKSLSMQRKFFDEAITEQERILNMSKKTEAKLREAVTTEKERSLQAIGITKMDFKTASDAERQRKHQESLQLARVSPATDYMFNISESKKQTSTPSIPQPTPSPNTNKSARASKPSSLLPSGAAKTAINSTARVSSGGGNLSRLLESRNTTSAQKHSRIVSDHESVASSASGSSYASSSSSGTYRPISPAVSRSDSSASVYEAMQPSFRNPLPTKKDNSFIKLEDVAMFTGHDSEDEVAAPLRSEQRQDFSARKKKHTAYSAYGV